MTQRISRKVPFGSPMFPDATGDSWDVLEALAGTIEAPSDWSIEHDHYLYGIPKRQPKVDHE